jgi:hypothetical protein
VQVTASLQPQCNDARLSDNTVKILHAVIDTAQTKFDELYSVNDFQKDSDNDSASIG